MAVEETALMPDYKTFGIFSLYVTLFVSQGILVTASKSENGTYNYSTTTVVLLSECFKLIISLVVFTRSNQCSIALWFKELFKARWIMALYLIPAVLYCLYNNLAFANLQHFDPTSYFLLLNFRTVATGIIFNIFFPSKKLTIRQWVALLILTAGCIVKQVRFDAVEGITIGLDYHLALLLLQVFCSCFAGVYNEFLLKDTGKDVNLWIQNAWVLGFQQKLATAFTRQSLASVFLHPGVLAIAVNNGVAGVTTSVFLKNLNSILKTFAGAVELLLTAVTSRILFGNEIDGSMMLSIALVSIAMYLYSTQPVNNKNKQSVRKIETGVA